MRDLRDISHSVDILLVCSVCLVKSWPCFISPFVIYLYVVLYNTYHYMMTRVSYVLGNVENEASLKLHILQFF